jgi:hypothetical protein
MHASSLSRVNKTCLEIAKKAKIPGWEDPKSDKIDLVTKWLENPQSGKWLLLVDNADDFDLLFGSRHLVISLPRSDEGAIIMTTRDARVGMEFAKKQVISIGALTQSESISLLANRLEKDESADEDIKKLSQELCGIPLALVQASSFIQQNYLPIPDYLDLYRYSDSEKVALLSEDFEDDIRDPESLNPIATTWSVSFDFIQKQNPLAAETLSVMSMLDPQAIPVSLIEFGKSRVAFSKAMGILQAFALITMRSDGPMCEGHREKSFYLHQLVRLAMRSWLNIQNRLESFTARALSTMAERFTDCQWETRAKWSSYLPHAAVLFDSDYLAGLEGLVTHVLHDHESGTLSHTPEGKICPVCAANLLTTLSTCHYITGKPTISFQEAEKAYRLRRYVQEYFFQIFGPQLTHNRKFLGENHMTTLDSLDLIARPAKDLYLFSKAVEVCQLAMMRKSETLGPDHPSTLRSMAYLGITLRLMERLQEAREIGCTVLERRRKILGDDHPDTLISMAHVGQLLTL